MKTKITAKERAKQDRYLLGWCGFNSHYFAAISDLRKGETPCVGEESSENRAVRGEFDALTDAVASFRADDTRQIVYELRDDGWVIVWKQVVAIKKTKGER